MQSANGKKDLGIVRRIVNYIKTHEEGYVVPWGAENQGIEGRNQVAEFANLICRIGTRVIRDTSSLWCGGADYKWSDYLEPDEAKNSGIVGN
jgi:hypothetical protein